MDIVWSYSLCSYTDKTSNDEFPLSIIINILLLQAKRLKLFLRSVVHELGNNLVGLATLN